MVVKSGFKDGFFTNASFIAHFIIKNKVKKRWRIGFNKRAQKGIFDDFYNESKIRVNRRV